ncbi:unnamed protein product (macronuclear) [Paramecium tetraurelia]|uniref:Uncharacterized protein n=1 Tax=Paramecium tetraurelia TaxID=5888 RepID=A0BT69_PARTE|nr:uncharacterized protein GSPATT00031968001 [Paramecium tetraurelia]CAK61736.1 unnamed protein product [Paramecium tetraurelia]|eukprot:XP_001429134.1 hypothetical protein (macronuclear) [Paramecium tetraurelia strain d4-2]
MDSDSLSLFKKKQQREISQALLYERQVREKELQKSQIILKSCERMSLITDRQLQKLKQSQISTVKHQLNEHRFKSLESNRSSCSSRPKLELDQEAYDRWMKFQKRQLNRIQTEKLRKFEQKIERGEKIRMMKELEQKNKQKLRIETNIQKEKIHDAYTQRLHKLQKQVYAKSIKFV